MRFQAPLSFLFLVVGFPAQLRADVLVERSILNPLGVSPLEGSALVDVDGDGDDDWVTLCRRDRSIGDGAVMISISENLGGQLIGPRLLATLPATPHDLAFGDLDADGDLDLVVALGEFATSELGWFEFVTLDGSLAPWRPIEVGGQRLRVALDDLDGDGDQDLVAGSFTSGAVDWFENEDGIGGLGPAQAIVKFGSPIGALDTLDTDADGDPDLVVSSDGDGGAPRGTYLVENEGGGLSPGTLSLVIPQQGAFAIGDVDGDGWSDLVLDAAGILRWFQTVPGTASLACPVVIDERVVPLGMLAERPGILELVDLDDDGDLDLLFDDSPFSYSDWTLVFTFESGEFGVDLIARRHAGSVTFLGASDYDDDGALNVVLRTGADSFARDLEYIACQMVAPGLQLSFGDAGLSTPVLWPDPNGGPLVDSLWRPSIDHTNVPGATFVDALLASTERIEFPLAEFGTLLLNPDPLTGFAIIASAFGFEDVREFAVPVPGNCSLVGQTWYLQVRSLGPGGSRLSSGLEVMIGAY